MSISDTMYLQAVFFRDSVSPIEPKATLGYAVYGDDIQFLVARCANTGAMHSALQQEDWTFGRRIQRLSLLRLLYRPRWCEQVSPQLTEPPSNARHSLNYKESCGDRQYEW